jgi:hypothetical protein
MGVAAGLSVIAPALHEVNEFVIDDCISGMQTVNRTDSCKRMVWAGVDVLGWFLEIKKVNIISYDSMPTSTQCMVILEPAFRSSRGLAMILSPTLRLPNTSVRVSDCCPCLTSTYSA